MSIVKYMHDHNLYSHHKRNKHHRLLKCGFTFGSTNFELIQVIEQKFDVKSLFNLCFKDAGEKTVMVLDILEQFIMIRLMPEQGFKNTF